jgi:Domain of unknown function (DUF5664)
VGNTGYIFMEAKTEFDYALDWFKNIVIMSQDYMEGQIVKPTKSDATSTELNEDWNDLPFAALQAAARRFNLGRMKHGRFNWQYGDEEFAEVRFSHMLRHAFLFQQNRRQEDLDALLCNAMMIAWYKERGFFKEKIVCVVPPSTHEIVKKVNAVKEEDIPF